jgi:hypothetical protein
VIYHEHIEVAEAFLLAADMLQEVGMGMIAAEAVWGAAAQVIWAANHSLTPRHPNGNRDRVAITSRLGDKYGLRSELDLGFNSVAHRLHNHFYTGRMNQQDLELHLGIGEFFVNRMIRLARLEHSLPHDDQLGGEDNV